MATILCCHNAAELQCNENEDVILGGKLYFLMTKWQISHCHTEACLFVCSYICMQTHFCLPVAF